MCVCMHSCLCMCVCMCVCKSCNRSACSCLTKHNLIPSLSLCLLSYLNSPRTVNVCFIAAISPEPDQQIVVCGRFRRAICHKQYSTLCHKPRLPHASCLCWPSTLSVRRHTVWHSHYHRVGLTLPLSQSGIEVGRKKVWDWAKGLTWKLQRWMRTSQIRPSQMLLSLPDLLKE